MTGVQTCALPIFAITSPLITNNDGSKMGKTADGAIWLDENKLSNYDFYQFWRNVNDADVPKFLNLFTKLPHEEISKLSKLKGQEINEAKKILAFEDRKSTRLNSSHVVISYAVFCLKKKK